MKKKIILILFIVLVGLLIYSDIKKTRVDNSKPKNDTVAQNIFDGKNSTFIINGESVTLKNGVSEEAVATGSASKIITSVINETSN